jgi:hypothetical protein
VRHQWRCNACLWVKVPSSTLYLLVVNQPGPGSWKT